MADRLMKWLLGGAAVLVLIVVDAARGGRLRSTLIPSTAGTASPLLLKR